VNEGWQNCGEAAGGEIMRLEGKLFKANLMMREAIVTRDDPNLSFVKELELALIDLCHVLDAPIPLWLSKNTHEFAVFRQTLFFSDQYTENVRFDRFQIRLL
jgi:hypothetical protein